MAERLSYLLRRCMVNLSCASLKQFQKYGDSFTSRTAPFPPFPVFVLENVVKTAVFQICVGAQNLNEEQKLIILPTNFPDDFQSSLY